MLAGNRWHVVYKPKKQMLFDDDHCYGVCLEERNELWIYNRLGQAKREQTFLHEAAHAILYTMGYHDHDEQIVEAVSQLVYQLILTQEYDDETLGTKESAGQESAEG